MTDQVALLAELLASHRSHRPVIEITFPEMTNKDYAVQVWPYLFGQFRIQLFQRSTPDGEGGLVREMCTHQSETTVKISLDLKQSPDPEAFCESLARPWNCEGPGARIRLDSQPSDRPETLNHGG